VNTQLRLSLVHLEKIGTSVNAPIVTLIIPIQCLPIFNHAKDKPQVQVTSLPSPLYLLLVITDLVWFFGVIRTRGQNPKPINKMTVPIKIRRHIPKFKQNVSIEDEINKNHGHNSDENSSNTAKGLSEMSRNL